MDDNKKDYKEKQEKIARFAKALGHPARIAILDFLAKRDTCYFGDINEELPIAKATVSQHLKELKDAGLIQGEIEILYQSGELGVGKAAFQQVLLRLSER